MMGTIVNICIATPGNRNCAKTIIVLKQLDREKRSIDNVTILGNSLTGMDFAQLILSKTSRQVAQIRRRI